MPIGVVGTCDRLYGPKFITFNVHQLLHLPQSVRQWGPLWAHSVFPFEDWNGRLLKFRGGTRAVGHLHDESGRYLVNRVWDVG